MQKEQVERQSQQVWNALEQFRTQSDPVYKGCRTSSGWTWSSVGSAQQAVVGSSSTVNKLGKERQYMGIRGNGVLLDLW